MGGGGGRRVRGKGKGGMGKSQPPPTFFLASLIFRALLVIRKGNGCCAG